MRDALNNIRSQIEDLELGQMRLSRYDEYFSDGNKRMGNIDINLKLMDKRISEEVMGVVAHKEKLGVRIVQLEKDFEKFKDEINTRHNGLMEVLTDVHKAKEDLKTEIQSHIFNFNEEIIMQNERISELGVQIYNNKNFTERKFVENADFDVRIRTATGLITEAQEKIEKLRGKIHKLKETNFRNDIHLKKYMPMQLAGLVFDSVYRTLTTTRTQAKFKEHFKSIFEAMEANVKNDISDRAPQFKDFTFDKFTYHYPATYFKAPLSDRSVKVKKEKKEQKEDDKDSHHHQHHKKHPHHSSRASNLHSSRASRAELHGPPADAHRL